MVCANILLAKLIRYGIVNDYLYFLVEIIHVDWLKAAEVGGSWQLLNFDVSRYCVRLPPVHTERNQQIAGTV